MRKPRCSGFVSQAQKGSEGFSRRLLVKDDLEAIVPLLIGQHRRNTVSQREILPRDVEALPALVRPGRADASPDFLASLVFACGLAVVEDM